MNKPLQNKLVVAYLVGLPVNADLLTGIPPCKDSMQTCCFTCWNTFKKNYIPEYYNKGLNNAVCTNPLTWTLDENYVNATYNKGALLPPFNKVKQNLCDAQVNKGLLWITKPSFRGSFFYRTPIYHAGDYNLFYLDVRENVALRVREYMKINAGNQ